MATRARTRRPTPTTGSLALISHLAQVVRRDADQALADVDGMRPRHLIALTLLRDHGPMAQAALGEGLRLDPSNVVALLNDLEARALVDAPPRPGGPPPPHRRALRRRGRPPSTAPRRASPPSRTPCSAASAPTSAGTLHDLLLRASGDRLPDCAEAATAEDAAGLLTPAGRVARPPAHLRAPPGTPGR